jgi:Cu(I)/Ag(I) efflux system periplasmic protein CusF
MGDRSSSQSQSKQARQPMKSISLITFCAALIASSVAGAQTQAPAGASLASAEVIAVYPKEKRVLLKHGPIDNLGMSDMTMEFGVANPRMLASFKRGKKVMFSAVRVKDDYVVTHVEAVR